MIRCALIGAMSFVGLQGIVNSLHATSQVKPAKCPRETSTDVWKIVDVNGNLSCSTKSGVGQPRIAEIVSFNTKSDLTP
jgi:hypothetical protein